MCDANILIIILSIGVVYILSQSENETFSNPTCGDDSELNYDKHAKCLAIHSIVKAAINNECNLNHINADECVGSLLRIHGFVKK